jgi:hypothetical protein
VGIVEDATGLIETEQQGSSAATASGRQQRLHARELDCALRQLFDAKQITAERTGRGRCWYDGWCFGKTQVGKAQKPAFPATMPV